MKQILLKFFIITSLLLFYDSSMAQLAKCKGKYFGNIIANTAHSNYNTYWNQVTSENGSKWGSIEGTRGVYNWGNSDLAYNLAKNNNGIFKFHTLVWGAQTPGWVASASTATITTGIHDFIKACSAHYAPMGGLSFIDVLNEPVNTPMPGNMKAALTAGYRAEAVNQGDLNNQYGWAIWCFQLARKYFPNSTLLINEYNIEMNWNNCRAPYIAMTNAIKNAPNLTDGRKNLIDGVGLQAHGIGGLTATNFRACIDEVWNKTGIPIHITEFDQTADPNEEKQRAVYASLIPIAWEHPHVAGITLWGYIQGATWVGGNGAAGPGGTDTGILYKSSYAANPLGERPAMTWLKSYLASRPNLSCCPKPAPFAACNVVNPPQGPYNGTVHSIPGTIQAEAFDVGGNGAAYLDNTPGSETGVNFRTSEDVDIEACTDAGAGYNIGYGTAGEWLEYTVNVQTTGTYALDLRVACEGDGRTLTVSMNGTPIASNVVIPNTTGWQAWQTVRVNNLSLSAGQKIMRITIGATDYVNINYVSFTGEIVACNPTAITPHVQVNGGAWQQTGAATINSGDQITLGPQPTSGGTWSWAGCGTSGSLREQIISPTTNCSATATYTNACGAKSTQSFTLTVNGPNNPQTGTGVTTYMNPVLPGSHPDQTLLKVGDDFYTAGSSFHWTPNLPIYHSTDLVHWEEVAQVVAPTWNGLVGQDGPKDGTWQGALAFFANKYWAFFFIHGGGQYFSTASDPKGTWTTPTLVQGSIGYDNSVFVDDNGRAYMLMKNGQSLNRIQEINSSGQLTGPVMNMDWVNVNNRFSWAEGPKMVKRNGRYYYFIAGHVYGGQYVLSSPTLTASESSWTIHGDFFRGTASGPFTGPNHITAPVQIADGTWWSLAHSYGNSNWDGQGRQSMLFQVFWDANGVPYANNPNGAPLTAPKLPASGNYEFPESDLFNSTSRKMEWYFHNTANVQKASLTARQGYLRLSPGNGTTHILQREPAKHYSIVTKVEINATANGQRAGLKLMNGEDLVSANVYSGYNNGKKIGITFNGVSTEVNNTIGNTVWLKIVRNQHTITGYFGNNGTSWTQIGNSISVAALDQAQTNDNAWVGTSLGLFATSLAADFDQFSFNHGFDPISVASYYHYNNVSISSGTVSNSADNGWCMLPGVTMESTGISARQIVVSAASASSAGTLEVWTDNIGTAGNRIATIPITSTGGTSTYRDFTANVTVSGQHDLYLRFVGGSNVFRLSTVRFTAGASNTPPTVSITSPANNAAFNAPASITINANAADANGTVSNVQFYNGTTLIGSDATSPYSFTWANVAAGTYTLTARATDNAGATTTSSTVTVVVSNVVVQSPYGGTAAPIPGKIEAENYDLGGAGVAFNETTASNSGAAYRTDDVDVEATGDVGGGFNIGWIESGEWLEYTVNVTAAGVYNLEARVASESADGTLHVEMDGVNVSGTITVPNTGAWQTYQSVSIPNISLTAGQKVMRIVMNASWFNLNYVSFTPVNKAPTVSITSPLTNATFAAPASIAINANASDTDGTVSNVQFFNGNDLLGSDATSPYSFIWTNVAAGTYTLTARATDNTGATTTSSSVMVIVNIPVGQLPFSGTPAPIPGKIEAENYDLGGQGLAFNEVTAGNSGAAYRTDDVDVEATGDAGGGFNIGWIETGEWLEYTVNVTATGVYNLEARLGSLNTGGALHVEMDGVNISGSIIVPNTGAWQTYQSVMIPNISLTAGQKVMRISMDAGWFNVNYVAFTPVNTTIQCETACSVEGTMNETFNAGFRGTGYVNTVDAIGATAGWQVNSPTAQSVTVGIRYATATVAGRPMSLRINGLTQVSNIPFPNTGGMTSWVTVNVPANLSAGVNAIELVSLTDEGSPYLDELTYNGAGITAGTCTAQILTAEAEVKAVASPNPSSGAFTLSVSEDVTAIRIADMNGIEVYSYGSLEAGGSIQFGENLLSGIYYMSIVYSSGRVESKKIQKTQ